ncbi:hypothetical protein PR048_033711 [Dryococelus australis]|uniref:Integrase catalytic domain-containing protein n=1 Tax=Dryococelus australis TaxID=614101 RepID=A0ABQ9G416_9NEOP|nr:hypothetical protein PR048_033711 [Dryococelus australis]
MASTLASHLVDPGFIRGEFAPGFLHVGIVLDNAACQQVFLGNSCFPRPCIPVPLHPRVSFHVMFRDDGHLRVLATKPVTLRVLPRLGIGSRTLAVCLLDSLVGLINVLGQLPCQLQVLRQAVQVSCSLVLGILDDLLSVFCSCDRLLRHWLHTLVRQPREESAGDARHIRHCLEKLEWVRELQCRTIPAFTCRAMQGNHEGWPGWDSNPCPPKCKSTLLSNISPLVQQPLKGLNLFSSHLLMALSPSSPLELRSRTTATACLAELSCGSRSRWAWSSVPLASSSSEVDHVWEAVIGYETTPGFVLPHTETRRQARNNVIALAIIFKYVGENFEGDIAEIDSVNKAWKKLDELCNDGGLKKITKAGYKFTKRQVAGMIIGNLTEEFAVCIPSLEAEMTKLLLSMVKTRLLTEERRKKIQLSEMEANISKHEQDEAEALVVQQKERRWMLWETRPCIHILLQRIKVLQLWETRPCIHILLQRIKVLQLWETRPCIHILLQRIKVLQLWETRPCIHILLQRIKVLHLWETRPCIHILLQCIKVLQLWETRPCIHILLQRIKVLQLWETRPCIHILLQRIKVLHLWETRPCIHILLQCIKVLQLWETRPCIHILLQRIKVLQLWETRQCIHILLQRIKVLQLWETRPCIHILLQRIKVLHLWETRPCIHILLQRIKVLQLWETRPCIHILLQRIKVLQLWETRPCIHILLQRIKVLHLWETRPCIHILLQCIKVLQLWETRPCIHILLQRIKVLQLWETRPCIHILLQRIKVLHLWETRPCIHILLQRIKVLQLWETRQCIHILLQRIKVLQLWETRPCIHILLQRIKVLHLWETRPCIHILLQRIKVLQLWETRPCIHILLQRIKVLHLWETRPCIHILLHRIKVLQLRVAWTSLEVLHGSAQVTEQGTPVETDFIVDIPLLLKCPGCRCHRKLSEVDKYHRNLGMETCSECIQGKLCNKGVPKYCERKAEKPLDVVHTDVVGKINPPSLGQVQYDVTMIDEYSRYNVAICVNTKNEVLDVFCRYQANAEKLHGVGYGMVQSGNGTEYTCSGFQQQLQRSGIPHRGTVPYILQQNRLAERQNRTMFDTVRCVLIQSGLTKEFWGDAVVINTCPSSAIHFHIHYELCFNRQLGEEEVAKLKIFGCQACAVRVNRKKLDSKAESCVLIGYEAGTKDGYRLWSLERENVIIRSSVVFEEEKFPFKGKGQVKDVSKSKGEETYFDITHVEGPEVELGFELEGVGQEIEDNEEILGVESLPDIGQEKVTEPMTVGEALSSLESDTWIEVEKNEMKRKDVWEIIERPENVKVFSLKHDGEGQIQMHKARLVAQGFKKQMNFGYEDTVSPVIKRKSMKLLMGIAEEMGSEEEVKSVRDNSASKLEIKDLGIATNVLSIKVEQMEGGVMLSQKVYIENIINDFCMTVCKPSKTMSPPGYTAAEDDEQESSATIYRSAVGTSCVARSTMDAEYMAMAEVSREVIWVIDMLSGLGMEVLISTPCKINADNAAEIKLSESDNVSERSKHIDIMKSGPECAAEVILVDWSGGECTHPHCKALCMKCGITRRLLHQQQFLLVHVVGVVELCGDLFAVPCYGVCQHTSELAKIIKETRMRLYEHVKGLGSERLMRILQLKYNVRRLQGILKKLVKFGSRSLTFQKCIKGQEFKYYTVRRLKKRWEEQVAERARRSKNW